MKKTLALSLMFMMSGCACFDGLCGDDELTVVEPQNAYKGYDNQGCNYMTGENCVRGEIMAQRTQPRPIVYRQEQPIIYVKEVERPTPVIIRRRPAPVVVEKKIEPQTTQQTIVKKHTEEKVNESNKTYSSCGDIKSTSKEYELNDGSHCNPQVKEVREPVEVVYKKTTYKTVYEPKTTTTITYEKEPYKQEAKEEVVKTTTTTTREVVTNNQPVTQNIETVTTTTSTDEYLDVLAPDEIK